MTQKNIDNQNHNMNHFRPKALFLLIIVLVLSAIACQSSINGQPAAEFDNDAIVRAAVATIEAQSPTVSHSLAANVTDQSPPLSFELQDRLIDVYKRINPSVVHIFVYSNALNMPLGSGSGFVYDDAGHIVTNNHVVSEGERFEIAFPDGSRQNAVLIGSDVDSDLAVIKVDEMPADVVPVSLGNSSDLEVGEFVIAIGNPFGEVSSMSVGIISGLGRTIDSQRPVDGGGRYSLPQVIQTDAAINPGNSGGPLLDLSGAAVGVNSAILTRSGTNSGVGFSIPINAVKRVVPSLIENGTYTYPYIGISMASSLNLETQAELGLSSGNGVYVTNVVAGTPAASAGLVGSLGPGGDFIVAIDGSSVKDSSALISYLVFETEVGQTVDLTVIRDGEEVIIPLTLGARP